MEGSAHLELERTPCACGLHILAGSPDGSSLAGNDNLGVIVVVRSDDDALCLGAYTLYLGGIEPDNGGHSPVLQFTGLLHRSGTQTHKPEGVLEAERSRCRKGRKFAERMAGHHIRSGDIIAGESQI